MQQPEPMIMSYGAAKKKLDYMVFCIKRTKPNEIYSTLFYINFNAFLYVHTHTHYFSKSHSYIIAYIKHISADAGARGKNGCETKPWR